MTRRIIFVLFDGFQLLDMAGPAGVFTTANAVHRRGNVDDDLYEVVLAAPGTQVRAGDGMRIGAERLETVEFGERDTIIMIGAYTGPLRDSLRDEVLSGHLIRAAERCERIGSVCTGAFILANAGLLDGYRATTHWAACRQFRTLFPRVQLEPDALYVNDRNRWTSAGVTTGIDMALAMVASDHGTNLKIQVARMLVVYAHRPGHQTQFSTVLEVQSRASADFSGLIEWMNENLHRAMAIAEIADHAGMSERNFLRRFKAATGMTPSKCLDSLRADRARQALEAGTAVKQAAALIGFRSEAAFRTFFTARMGVPPSHYARMHDAET